MNTIEPPDDYVVDCTNDECGWQGLLSETVTVSDEYSCPKCFFLIEPHEF